MSDQTPYAGSDEPAETTEQIETQEAPQEEPAPWLSPAAESPWHPVHVSHLVMGLAFVVGGWPMLLAVVAIYCVVNVVLQVLVQPKFVSDAVDLSLTLSFFSVIFWTFIIGPLGAILSIPLTLFVRTLVLEGDPQSHWLRWLSGDRTAVPPPDPSSTQPRRRP